MKSRLRWLVTSIIILGLLAALIVWRLNTATAVYALKAQRESIRSYVDERAVTRLPQRHVISMPYDARIVQLDLREGDTVQAGQVVARLVEKDLELEFAAALADVQRMEASLAENADVTLELTAKKQAELYSQAMDKQVESAESQLAATSFWAQYWQRAADRARQLAQRTAQPEEEVELAEANEMSRQAEMKQRRFDIQAQQFMARAMGLVPQLVTDYLHRKSLQGAVLQQQLAAARAKLEEVRLRRERAVLTSPVNGVVLQREKFSEQFLPAGTTLMEIGDLAQLEIEAEILSQEASQIEVGDPVEIYGPAVGREAGAGLVGVVQRIEPDAFTKISSLGVEQQRVLVIIQLTDSSRSEFQKLGIGVGYRVRVRIFTQQRDDTIVVPRSSLFRNDAGGYSVYTIRDGKITRTAVQVGLMNDQWAEATQGIEAGTMVVVAPDSQLDVGTNVTILTPTLSPSHRGVDE